MKGKAVKVKSPSKEVAAAPSMAPRMPEMTKQSPEEKKREEKYKLEDDSRTVKSYLDLRKDPPRHARTVNYMRDQAADLETLDTPGPQDAMPRKATRVTARKSGRPRGR